MRNTNSCFCFAFSHLVLGKSVEGENMDVVIYFPISIVKGVVRAGKYCASQKHAIQSLVWQTGLEIICQHYVWNITHEIESERE